MMGGCMFLNLRDEVGLVELHSLQVVLQGAGGRSFYFDTMDTTSSSATM
jgi:hypothetical protein